MTTTHTGETSSIGVYPKVLATLNYYLEPERGGSDKYILGSGNDLELNKYDSAEVYVSNIRGNEADFRLDEHGFELLQDVETIKSSDPTYLREEYYAIVARALAAKVGASEVVVTSNIRRLRKDSHRRKRIPISYASLVHVDQSWSGARVKYAHKCPQFSKRFDNSRWAVINWWQPIDHAATRWPLAVCDGSSIADEDWREIIATSPKRRPKLPGDDAGDVGTPIEPPCAALPPSSEADVRSNPDHGMWNVVKPRSQDEHKWYFFQDVQPHEALLIKIFDSQTQGVSRRTPHSAFQSPIDYGPERTSIEFRCLAFWDEKPLVICTPGQSLLSQRR
ncbi:hypothetical protein AC579_2065 [Pseudocercospora musae]|uniref:Uncharacterized protein n=1 Tax=Pseudocercospora musae TaxID=113226 RepID=A0A139IFL7_9PEZI|nr:hypothetical protein AC579_2065 [Pseudocercospora musae]